MDEQVILALAAVAAGDDDLARRLERAVLADHGEQYGPWVRVKGESGREDPLLTARLAIVAASLGDPLAAGMDTYLADNPPKTTAIELERALAAAGWAERIPAADAAATLTLDGARRNIDIRASKPVRIVLTPAQAASARLNPVSGTVLVATSTEQPLDVSSLEKPGDLTISRKVRPSGQLRSTDMVHVDINVHLGAMSGGGCWNVTELVPSGLTPIVGDEDRESDQEYDDQGNPIGPVIVSPWRVVGQRLDFCVTRQGDASDQVLRYVARVVTPGTYTWEPAVIQASLEPGVGTVIPATKVTIRGLR